MRNAILVGERLYLRPMEAADAEVMASGSALEPERMMERMRVPYSRIAVEKWIAGMHERQPPEHILLAVCLIEDDRFIGSVNLMEIDYVNRTAETGSWIDVPALRGKGSGTEAKMLLLEYAFDHLQLHTLMSFVWEPNERSAGALLKQGYRPAGRYKYADLRDGEYRDGLLFDVLREDWLKARERLRGG